MTSNRRFSTSLSGPVAIAAALLLWSAPAAAAPFRYGVDTPIDQFVDVTAEDFERYFEEQGLRGMRGTGSAFVTAGRRYGINPIYIMAHAGWESAWGTSRIARDKKNLFGYGAYDRCPYNCAKTFASYEEGVSYVMAKVKEDYLVRGGDYYGGASTLRAMNKAYATDRNWARGISGIMNEFQGWYEKNGGTARPGAGSGASASLGGNGVRLSFNGGGSPRLDLGLGNGGSPSFASASLGSGILPGDQPLGGNFPGGFGGLGGSSPFEFKLGDNLTLNVSLGNASPAGPWDPDGIWGSVAQMIQALFGINSALDSGTEGDPGATSGTGGSDRRVASAPATTTVR